MENIDKIIKDYKITLKGKPIADGRPRARGFGRNITVYDPKAKEKKEINYKLRDLAKDFEEIKAPKNKFKLDEVEWIEIDMKFYFKIPDGKNKACKALSETETLRNINQIDTDNLIKLYGDCLHNVIYDNDCLVTKVSGEKLFTLNEEDERVEIIVNTFKYKL